MRVKEIMCDFFTFNRESEGCSDASRSGAAEKYVERQLTTVILLHSETSFRGRSSEDDGEKSPCH
jgi:hypothetical protein